MTVIDLIEKHEGSSSMPYLDSRGIETVGVGHNLIANPLPGETYPLSAARIQEILAQDLQIVVIGLTNALPWVAELDLVRQAVLFDMAFNMGIDGLLKWPNTLRAIQEGRWQDAADSMLGSLWETQVGPRATEDAMMMSSGEWPS